jgi:hypothetical protein
LLPPRRERARYTALTISLLLAFVVSLTLLGAGATAVNRFARRIAVSDDKPIVSPAVPAEVKEAEPPGDIREPTDVLVTLPRGQRSVAGVLAILREPVQERFRPLCRQKGIPFPPPRVTLIALKQERLLEVWAAGSSGPFRRLATYPIRAASGGPGPKRREGDRQVPEGNYRLTTLNPNSSYHLSLRVDYPDAEDTTNRVVPHVPLGGDIYVHGNQVSIGCVAIGDAAIEEVFTLVALAQPSKRRILLAPWDLRVAAPPETNEAWLKARYARLKREMAKFPRNGGGGASPK